MDHLLNRLQLKEFRLILAISETGQLAMAAERLSLTQPAASRLLAGIERKIGIAAFHRHPKGMVATPVGAILARNAQSLINGIVEALREVRSVGAGRAGIVRVGAVTGGAVAFVVPAIQQLKKTASGVDVHVDVGPSDMLIDGLVRGDYDFVLSRIPAQVDARDFQILPGREEIVRFVVRAGHALAGRGPLSLKDLSGFEWVIQPMPTPMRQAVEAAFIAHQVALPNDIVNTTSLLVMIAYLASSQAIAPTSGEVAELISAGAFGASISVLDVIEPVIVHPYHLLTRKTHVMSPLAERLRRLVFAALASPRE